MRQAIGGVLPAAVAIALSPFPVVGIVLLLASPRGRLTGPLFATGWLIGLTALTVVVTALLGGADDPESDSAAIADWARVAGGVTLMVLGIRTWRKRPRAGDVADPPAWMATLDSATPRRAFVLGLGLAGLNPKNFVLVGAAAASIAESGVSGAQVAIAVAAFVLIGSSSVIGAVVVRVVGGDRGAATLDKVRAFMIANSDVITMVVLVVLGAKVLGDGLGGLGR